jgi:hypothetical protein
MASAIRQMTGVGGDVRKIARLLQKKAPPGHMLAYINQEEADLLKARGGSGKPHEDTGVPSFEEIPYDYSSQLDYSPTGGGTAPNVYKGDTSYGSGETTAFPDAVPIQTSAGDFVAPGSSFSGQFPAVTAQGIPNVSAPPVAAVAGAPVDAEGIVPYIPTPRETGNYPGGSVLTGQRNVGADDSFFSNMSDQTKARLGIGGAQALLGAYQVSQAADQSKRYREDMAKLAQPYQAEGKKLIAQAQSGQLTPAAQQQLQAAQAQAAQGAQARGGVGAQQAMMAVENMRQQLLQNQYDYGLKVSGIGDQIATGAIKAGMQADQYVNSLAGSYATNIARTLSNSPTYVTSYSQQNQ